MREIRFVDGVAIAIMDEAPPNFVSARQVVFRGTSKQIYINDHVRGFYISVHSSYLAGPLHFESLLNMNTNGLSWKWKLR